MDWFDTEASANIRSEELSADQFAQSDFNRMQTLAMKDNLQSLERLLEKLYRRNPAQWRRAGFSDLQAALDQGRSLLRDGAVPADMREKRDIEVLSAAMDPQYGGDRVAAFVLGMANMILAAHGERTRFYIGNLVSAQKIFNAARNVEIAAWILANRRGAGGDLLLLSNHLEADGSGANLSFEREFGAIVARLDLLAELQDESLRRIGINYVQNLLFLNFLPVR